MVCMHVSLIELSFQSVMRQILALECMLLGVRRLLPPKVLMLAMLIR
jgi:hypothetical protein